ncbi:YciI family protein [Luteipulveratus sp. YIM 133132]|uniref:YciI family protein n=1 Tax=Luteipulveratus flavus TaxID=3031728 RepID=UPI0023B03C39|nr:YciI family protein [Luteipulveratus sp. YIM 133132]MDE9366705.1 YciI family protein [Luteipulveratus sp. YIM 133132]
MLLIRSSAQRWAQLTDEERGAIGEGTMAVGEQLHADGRYVDGAGLADPSRSRVVRRGEDDEPYVTDGPLAEAKEHLAGFMVVECDSEEDALAVAARLPDAAYGGVDVRECAPPLRPSVP